jgi:Tfp pilus assembly protein PilF
MLRCILLLCCTVLAACADPPAAPPRPQAGLFHDEAFAPPQQHIDAGELFTLTDTMRQRVLKAANPLSGEGDPRRRLLDVLYHKERLEVQYDAAVTRTAAQTYAARAGNCLSLVIMTAAFAKELGLPVEFRSIDVTESWMRSGDLYFGSGHVNLALGRPLGDRRFDKSGEIVIDFVPASETAGMTATRIGEATVVAMFMNNRAAESLARGAVDDAYWYAREAVRQDPHFLVAYNTLGVVYLRRRQPQWAQSVFASVLERQPDNTKVMGNEVLALRAIGQPEAAERLAARLALLEPEPPFFYFRAGLAAMDKRDFVVARAMFRKEAEHQAFNPEVQFWLAQANYRLGNVAEAERHLDLAQRNSLTPQDHAIYAAKLAWLRAHQMQ